MAITLEELQIKFKAETGNLSSQISGIKQQLGSMESSVKTTGGGMAGLGAMLAKGGLAVVAAKAGKELIQLGKESLNMANDVVESEQLFSVSMGKMESSARAWSDSLSSSLGLNAYDLRKNVGMLNVMFNSMGLGEQEAYDMSTSLTKLANDMASFYNLDTEEAFTKLRAGITGETEPLKRLGILVDEQTVAQYALKSGISKTGKELTQQQKLQARYGAIMEQTMKAQGDLARTMDSPTNQLRRLNSEFDMAKIALGQALQPALIAVLPHVTNFATGLTRMLKGGSGGDPLSGTINDLAGATAAIKSRVDTSIVDIVAEIARLQDGTEEAVDGYIQAASETRDLYININLKPQNTVYTRINSIFAELDSKINTEATRVLKDGVKAQLDIILQDGVVTGPERQSLLDYLTEIEEKLKEEARENLKAIQAEAEYKLNTGEIEMPTHDQMLIDAQTAYDTDIGTIEGLIAEAKAEVGISDWTASTISADDRTKMTNAINKEIAAGEALLVSANAQVQALFEGSSLEQAVLGMYGDLTTEINANNDEINKLLTAWLDEDDGAAYEKAMAKREENKKLLAIASGGLTAEGKINKALLAIGGATPEELANFTKGYAETFKEMTEGYVERGKERENALLNMPDSYFAKQGKTRKQMIDENTAETNAYIAQANDLLSQSVMDALGTRMNNLANGRAIYDLANEVYELAKTVGDSGQDATGLLDFVSQLGPRVQEAYPSLTLPPWMDGSYQPPTQQSPEATPQQSPEATPQPPPQPSPLPPPQPPVIPEPPPKLTQYYNPMAYENKGLVFSGADITISKPRMKYQSLPDGYAGRGGSFDVNVDVAPQDIVVNMYLDETQLGRANIRATQTVTKSTGGGGSHVSVPFSPVPVQELE